MNNSSSGGADNLKRTDSRAAAVGDTVGAVGGATGEAVGALGTGKVLDSIVALEQPLSSETGVQRLMCSGVGRAGVDQMQANPGVHSQLLFADLPPMSLSMAVASQS